MLSEKMEAALNKQINAELYSSYLYLSMSAYFESENYEGFSAWMKMQSQEEYGHAMKIYDFVNQRGGRVKLSQIDAPAVEWDSVEKVFEETLTHEKHVTSLIHDLVNIAAEEKDHASASFLQWFVDEQVEEEDTASTIVENLKRMDGNRGALFMYDRELGRRGAVQ
jgi:ferritin